MVFPNEGQLIASLKKGDQTAVATWYRLAKPKLLAFFSRQVGGDADAQELLHDTYLSCLSSLPLFRSESGLWSYMLSIARHELADYWRKKYAKRVIQALPFGDTLLDTVADSSNEEESIKNEVSQVIFKKLPEEITELLQLKYVDDLSVKELAAKYGLSFAAMQSKLYRAKELFKQEYRRSVGQ